MLTRGQRLKVPCRLLARIVIAATAATTLAGCASSLLPPPEAAAHSPQPIPASPSSASIGVVDEGWHTGLVLPVAELHGPLADVRQVFPHARYLVFGWGNEDFYTAAHPGIETAMAALFPSASVVFVRGLPGAPEKELPSGAQLRWLCASQVQLRKLKHYLAAYLRKGPSGRPVNVAPGPWPRSRFFASTGTYDAFHTCNTWTVAALEFAGFPVNGQGVLFAPQVMSEIQSLRTCHK